MKNYKSSLLILQPIIFISAIFFIFFFYKFGDLLIFTEARDYIKYGGWINDYFSFLKNCFLPSGQNTRYVSMFGFNLMKNSCGYNNVCINTYQLLVILLAGIFLYIHSYQLFKNIIIASIISLMWFFSLPTLDAISWQAVNHDKMAALFVFITLVISSLFLEKNGRYVVFLSNVIITFLLILAYNSKESSFLLMPLILLQYVLYSTNIKDFLKNIFKIIIPLIFSLYFIVGYFLKLADFWKEHTLSNDITNSLKLYANFLLNSNSFSVSWVIVFAIIIFIPLVLVLLNYLKLKKEGEKENRSLNRNLIYSYLFFILSISIAMKARYPSVFYMLIPLAGFLLTIMSSINIIMHYLSDKISLRSLFIVTMGGLMVFHIYNYNTLINYDSKYTRLLQHSNNMSQTFRIVANELELSKEKTYNFVIPQNEHHFYILRGGTEGADKTLINFIYQVDGEYLVNYINYNDVKEISNIIKENNGYYIILDPQYNLLKMIEKPGDIKDEASLEHKHLETEATFKEGVLSLHIVKFSATEFYRLTMKFDEIAQQFKMTAMVPVASKDKVLATFSVATGVLDIPLVKVTVAPKQTLFYEAKLKRLEPGSEWRFIIENLKEKK